MPPKSSRTPQRKKPSDNGPSILPLIAQRSNVNDRKVRRNSTDSMSSTGSIDVVNLPVAKPAIYNNPSSRRPQFPVLPTMSKQITVIGARIMRGSRRQHYGPALVMPPLPPDSPAPPPPSPKPSTLERMVPAMSSVGSLSSPSQQISDPRISSGSISPVGHDIYNVSRPPSLSRSSPAFSSSSLPLFTSQSQSSIQLPMRTGPAVAKTNQQQRTVSPKIVG